jgi:predicted nucleotidyltransferase
VTHQPILERVELPSLCRRCRVQRLDVFGSAVTGTFDVASSDLDFLVTFEPLAPAEYAISYFALRDGLAALYGHNIDLVTEPSLANPHFRARVDAERKTLFTQ